MPPRQGDLPLGVAAEDQGVGLPGVGDRHQVDAEPVQDRLELGGQPEPEAGPDLRRERLEVEAGQEVPGPVAVELQVVHRLQERAQGLPRRAEAGGDARGRRDPRLAAGGQHVLADHHADGRVARVGRLGAEALDQCVEVAQAAAGEQPGVLALGQADPLQHDPAAMVRVPDVAVAVGVVGHLLGEHEPAPLHHEGELAGHLAPSAARSLGGMSRRSRHRAAIAKSRRPIAAPANVRIVAFGSVRPSAIVGPGLLGLVLAVRGEPPEPADPPHGLGVEPPVAVGLASQGDRLPGHLVQHHPVALGVIGDAVKRDRLAIQDELELVGQQGRVPLAHLGIEPSRSRQSIALAIRAVDRS